MTRPLIAVPYASAVMLPPTDSDVYTRPSGWTWTALGTGVAGLLLSPLGILVPVCLVGIVIAVVGAALDRERGHPSGVAWIAAALNVIAIAAGIMFALSRFGA